MIVRDDLHFSFKETDGYNKLYNLIICAREAGKTADLEFTKIYKAIKKGFGVIILKRYAKEINKLNLQTLQDRINLYLPENDQIKINFEFGSQQIGIIRFNISQNNIKYNGMGLFVWIGLDDQIIKNIYIKNPKFICFDEYIVNNQSNEKYIKNEFDSITTLYKTIERYRENKTEIKIYCCGNPYSKLNPFIEYFRIDKRKLNEGNIIEKDNYIVYCYKLKDELKKYLLENDKNYKFDESYRNFALDGRYIYENKLFNILDYLPKYFKLDFVILIIDKAFNKRYIGIFQNYNYKNSSLDYCVKEINKNFKNKELFTFNLENMENGATLLNSDNMDILDDFKKSLTYGHVGFVNSFYYINDLFKSYKKMF